MSENETPQQERKFSKSQVEFIKTVTRVCQKVGLPRTFGEIYGLIFLSEEPLSLDDISNLLAISKGSASSGTRRLLELQAIKQVWIAGSRKDYFEMRLELREVLKECYTRFVKPNLSKSTKKILWIKELLNDDFKSGEINESSYTLTIKRLNEVEKIEKKISRLLPLVDRFI